MANRNSESRFAQVPHANIQRARFKRDYSNITTINEGELVPIYVDEVLPGDTISLNQNSLIRMSTPLYPVMDNAYCDFYYFFVPCRLLWEHWENLMGQNDSTYWAETTEYSVPQTKAPSGGWVNGTIADYMGIPTQIENLSVNSMPFRAYARIWNEWFRDENLQQPVVQDMDDADNTGSNTGTNLTDAQNGGLPLKVAKRHDYFTSCLPAPQKGEASTLPINLKLEKIPVVTGDTFGHPASTSSEYPLFWANMNGNKYAGEENNNGYATPIGIKGGTSNTTVGTTTQADTVPEHRNGLNGIVPMNLWATATTDYNMSITINELRQAIAIQQILEADARGGTRYVELLAHEFGVTSPDSRLQRSEYIGGSCVPININQVIQTSATESTSPQGNTAAYSMTTSRDKMVSYSAVEHGYIIGLACIRVDHSYQQGLSRMWTRKGRFDFYHPMLANLSEMAVLNQEIYAQGNSKDTEVFGYQEAWADYRYHPNIVTGEMRSNYAQSLDAWHYADHYEQLPMLSSTWIQEGTENIDRTLAVQAENSHQFIADFYFDQTWTRPMPIYSVPGLSSI